jgi:hypothetical protein
LNEELTEKEQQLHLNIFEEAEFEADEKKSILGTKAKHLRDESIVLIIPVNLSSRADCMRAMLK